MGTIIDLARAPVRPAAGGATEAMLVGDSRQIAASLLRLRAIARYVGEVARGSDQYPFLLSGDVEFDGPGRAHAALHRRGSAIVEEGKSFSLTGGEERILEPGQAIHFPMSDSHALRSADGTALNFPEFYVPGVFRTLYDDD